MKTINLIIESISSPDVDIHNWYPDKNEDVFISLDIYIDCPEEGQMGHRFDVTIATLEGVKKFSPPPILVTNRTIILSEFKYELIEDTIRDIVKSCARHDWFSTCDVLQRYFWWEYEDFIRVE